MTISKQFHGGLGGALALVLIFLVSSLPANSVAQTLQRIQRAGEINMGYVSEQAPFSARSADGKPHGYAIELCDHVIDTLEQRLGLTALTQHALAVHHTVGLRMIEQGKLDILCGAVPETLQTRELASFSIPIYVSGIGALVRKDAPPALLRVLNGRVAHSGPIWRATVNAGLANHTYAVHAGTASEAWVRKQIAASGVIAKVLTVARYEDGIAMVAGGRADAFFADRAVLMSHVSRRASDEKLDVLDRRFTLEPIALALRRGDEDFRLAVDAALSQLYRSGDYARAYARHFGEPTATARLLFQAYALP